MTGIPDMDPAQAIELAALGRQKPMNDVIDLGSSNVQQLYKGKTIFVTGGFGFIGKQLIEKLFRACDIKKLYILARSKKGKSIQERLDHMLTNPVYDVLRTKKPNFADKITPIEGNVEELKLGLNEEDRAMIAKEVDIIFHVAATVNFDEPLRRATLTNVRGTREILQLAKTCDHLIKYVHISTAFTHATEEHISQDVEEKFYPVPVSPGAMITMVEEVDEKRLNAITAELIKGWPNTYTFTKAIAEELVNRTAGDLPACIVRPPIVLPSYYEPQPGWLDFSTLAGPSGIYLVIGLGIIKAICVDGCVRLAMTPIDYVNNAIIASVWDSTERRKKTGATDIPIYTMAKKEKFFKWDYLGVIMRSKCERIYSPKVVWYAESLQIKSRKIYTLVAFFLHYIPAYIIDFVCTIIGKRPQQISSFVDVYKKIDKLGGVYDYFLSNDWDFRDDNVEAMLSRLSPADKAIFNCDLNTLDLAEYIQVWAIGLRKYILKDGLKNSHIGGRNQKYFFYAFLIFNAVYFYCLYWITSFVFSIVWYIFNILF
ncbi:fatty acyl-CoA reductase wat-like [Anticarsia gemmatalis]|uniref:fatty acyl-CoA reductase wat-like n=1 Tax=Anticarsia gemmatalis TaxID=129554 RepID=UPI003F759170